MDSNWARFGPDPDGLHQDQQLYFCSLWPLTFEKWSSDYSLNDACSKQSFVSCSAFLKSSWRSSVSAQVAKTFQTTLAAMQPNWDEKWGLLRRHKWNKRRKQGLHPHRVSVAEWDTETLGWNEKKGHMLIWFTLTRLPTQSNKLTSGRVIKAQQSAVTFSVWLMCSHK